MASISSFFANLDEFKIARFASIYWKSMSLFEVFQMVKLVRAMPLPSGGVAIAHPFCTATPRSPQLDRIYMLLLSTLASTRWVLATDIDRRIEERKQVQQLSGGAPPRCPFTRRFGALVSTPPALVAAVAAVHVTEAVYFAAEAIAYLRGSGGSARSFTGVQKTVMSFVALHAVALLVHWYFARRMERRLAALAADASASASASGGNVHAAGAAPAAAAPSPAVAAGVAARQHAAAQMGGGSSGMQPQEQKKQV